MRSDDHRFLDAVLNASDAAIFVTDCDGRIVRCNDRFGRVTGTRPPDAVGRLLWELDPPPREPSRMQGVLEAILRDREPRRHESEWQVPGMGPRIFEWSLSPLLDEGGQVTHVVTVGIDVTERHRAEQQAREAEDRFRAFFDNAPIGKSMTSVDGRILRVNAALCSMLGYTAEELQSRCYPDITHPDDIEPTREFVRSVVSGEQDPGTMEKRFVARDGHVVWTLVRSALQRDPEGRPMYLLTHVLDITEQKRAEAERARLQESVLQERDRLSALLNSMADEVWFTDPQGNFTLANPAARREFGIEVLDESPALRALGGELVTGYEELVRTSVSGDLRTREVSAAPVRDSQGAIVGAVSVVRDVTALRQTQQLMQRAQRLESVGLLAGGIAHDFNNLLTGILGNTSLAHTDVPAGSAADQWLSEVESAVGRAQDLTRQLLTFSKGGTPVRRVTRIGVLARESAAFSVRGTNARCEVEIPDTPWPVEVDEGQIGQVISNLVINAAEAMPAGGNVRVSVRNVPAGSVPGLPEVRHVEIAVQDEGSGVPPEHVSRIFDPYFTTKKKGSGLGLATSDAIVRKHGGVITLDSAPGKGSLFRVFLPASAKEPPLASQESDTSRLRGRVLVMDDDEPIRTVCCQMLAHLGCEVEAAPDGRDAIERYQAAAGTGRPFDAVILDLTVQGGMGGRETLERLRQIDPEVRAVVSSGYSNDPVLSDFRAFGFAGIMPKPYRMATLRKVMVEVLPGSANPGG